MRLLRCDSTRSESSATMIGESDTTEPSELETRLRQLGWIVTMTPLMEVALRQDCTYAHEWRIAKGPLEIRAPNAAEVTRLVAEVETRAAGARRPSGTPVIERVEGPIPPRCSVLRRPPKAKPPVDPNKPRRRRKRVTMELVRCGYLHERHGTYCGALVWRRPGEQLKHATESHGITDSQAAIALFTGPRKKLGTDKKEGD